jgi:hypothetical protein
MKKQTKQLITLGALLIAWAISWRVNRIPATPTGELRAQATKSAQPDNLLNIRFHKVRAEMDGLYHYRIKPTAFDSKENPFRIPQFMEEAIAARTDSNKPPRTITVVDQTPTAEEAGDSGIVLLRHAIENIRLGGVVTRDDASQLNVNGELHKQGELFAATVKGKPVLLRIVRLTTSFVILALDDPASGNPEVRVKLN